MHVLRSPESPLSLTSKTIEGGTRAALVALSLLGGSAGAEPIADAEPAPEAVGDTSAALRLAPIDNCSTSQKTNLRGAERLALYITRPYIVEWVTEPRGTKPHYLVDKFFD